MKEEIELINKQAEEIKRLKEEIERGDDATTN